MFKYVWHESSLVITGLDYGYIRWKVQSNNWKDASGGTVSYLHNSNVLSLCAQCLNYKVHTYTHTITFQNQNKHPMNISSKLNIPSFSSYLIVMYLTGNMYWNILTCMTCCISVFSLNLGLLWISYLN